MPVGKIYDHCNQRLQERYNIQLTFAEFIALSNAIKEGRKIDKDKYKMIFLERRNKRLSVWLILVKNRWTTCFYDNKRHCIVTFLSLTDCLDKISGKVEQLCLS